MGIMSGPTAVVGTSESIHAGVCNVCALDEPDTLQLWQRGESSHRLVSEMGQAAEINVSDAVAARNQTLDALVRDVAAVAEMDVVQVLAQSGDGKDCSVRDVGALGQDKITEAWRDVDDLLYCDVGELRTRCQIQDAKMLVDLERW